jgi:hypothetical protein
LSQKNTLKIRTFGYQLRKYWNTELKMQWSFDSINRDQGCQMVYLHTKNTNFGIFRGLGM